MGDAKTKAAEHWAFVEELLRIHGVGDGEIRMIGFHYVSAFIHGWGHGAEGMEFAERSASQ